MVDVKTIEKMYTSLWRGYKDYKFSQLRSALREYSLTDLDSLKLNLKGDREALLKIAEKFLMNALDSGVHGVRDNNSQGNDYPNIPLTYAWQFEGVDNGEDYFLYPTTPLTCDVLNGQCCDLNMVANNVYDDSGNVAGTIVFGDPIVGRIVSENQPNKLPTESNKSKSTVSNLLVYDWLLIENSLSYSPETDDGNKSDLSFVVNFVMASISRRREARLASFEIKRYEAIGLLRQIYSEFCNNALVEKLSRAMQRDDELYRDSCQEILFEVRKKAIITPFAMPDFIKECSEVKSIIESKTNKNPSITLINGWLHPLSEVSQGIPETDGEPYCNAWQFASMIVGAATGRCPKADSSSVIRILIDFDVIESESSVALEQAKSDNSIYLQLVSGMKEAFEVDGQLPTLPFG